MVAIAAGQGSGVSPLPATQERKVAHLPLSGAYFGPLA